jgi:hypothetical protein
MSFGIKICDGFRYDLLQSLALQPKDLPPFFVIVFVLHSIRENRISAGRVRV